MRLGDVDSSEVRHIRIPKMVQVLMGSGHRVVRILKQDCSWSSVQRKTNVTTWRGTEALSRRR